MSMSRLTRRSFLKTLAAAGTVAIAGTKASGKILGANDRLRVAVAGLNGRGSAHVGAYAKMENVEIAYLVDADKRVLGRYLKQDDYAKITAVQDVRKALEDQDLQAVSIATPNHWHALMTIWACQAGKHVYVEKPCSHNIHEGRIAVETAKKHKRIVQHGTQARTESDWAKMPEIVKSGRYGKLLVSRGLCYKDGAGWTTRGDIGFKETKDPPAELDFDMWTGPAPKQPYHENLVHYRWHWFWDFGNGDIGNQGVHEMDRARWAIPGATLPKGVISFGGRIGVKDQGQTPSTQVVIFDFGETQLIFEVRGLHKSEYHGQSVGNTLHFEEGLVAGNKFFPKGKTEGEALPDVKITRGPGKSHFDNFIAAVRSGRQEELNAPILEGHYSAALCHLANASYRLGEPTAFNPRTKAFEGNKDATDALERMEEHLAKECKIKLEDWKYTLGRKLQVDAKAEKAVDDDDANKLLTGSYRKGYEVPEKVG
jgi:predicted dehydrogenase